MDLGVPHFQTDPNVPTSTVLSFFWGYPGYMFHDVSVFLLGNMSHVSHDVMVQPIHHNGQHGG